MINLPQNFNCLLLIFLTSITIDANSQLWLKKGTGTQQSEALDVSVDINGNTYTTGYFFNSISFGSFNANASGLTDVYLVKTDSTGNFQWLVTAGGSGLDKGYSVKTDNSGNVYVTGVFSGSISFGSTVLTSNNLSQDIFLVKYNAAGVLQWVKTAGGPLSDASNAITTDNTGNVYITGFFEGVAQFESTTLTSAINPVTTQFSADVFTAKYDLNGNLIWVEQGTTIEFAAGVDITSDVSGNVYVTGHFSGNITFDFLHTNNSFNSIFIVKYNSSGIEQWFKMMGAGTTNSVSGIASDNISNVYLTGNFTGGTIIFGTPNITLTNNYPERIFLVKFDSAGNVTWSQTTGSASPVSVKNIATDNFNNPYLIGDFECKFSQYADQYGQGTFNSVGFKDVYVSKYDTSGNWQWSRQFGGPKNDFGNGISIDPNNHAVICGNFINSINFPVNPANFYSPVGDFIPPSINQNITYCGDTNYGSFAALQGNSLMNSFIAKPIDLSREPYDYYKRTGSGCNRDVVNICISETPGLCSSDTILIEACNLVPIEIFANSNTAPGPNFNYIWNNGFTTSSTTVGTADINIILNSTSEDGCFISSDTAFIDFNTLPYPQPPPISDNVGINNNTTNPLPIIICPPDSEVVLTGTNTGLFYYWTGFTPGNSPLSITVNQSGIYEFYVGNADSCISKTEVEVQIITPLVPLIAAISSPDTFNVCSGEPVMWHAYNLLALDTNCLQAPITVSWTTNPSTSIITGQICPAHGYFYATQSGLYEINGILIRSDSCGQADTNYVTKNIFVNVNPNPGPFNISVTGNLTFCPGSSATVTASGGAPVTTYEWYNLFNGNLIGTTQTISISQPGNYYLIGTSTNSFGCSTQANLLLNINEKQPPPILMNPPSGVICPGGNVTLLIPATPGNFQWFGPSGAIGGNVNNITVSTPGNYFAIYKDNDSCEFILTAVEVQQYATPYLSAGPSNVLCPGETVTIEVITNSGSAVQWLPPLSGTDPTQIITQPGTYMVMITSCGIQTIDSVTILSSNVEAIINPPGTVFLCQGDSILLTANPGMTSYTWMPGNINTQNIFVTQSGLYELTTTDVYGCSASASVEVYTYLLELPLALGDTVCEDSSTVLTGYFFGNGTIAWYDSPNGNLLDTGMYFTTPPLQNTTTFYMQAFDSVCVSGFEPVEVFVYPSPSAPFIASNSPVCSGDTILLSTSSSLPGTIYNWTGPNNFTSNLQYPLISNTSNLHSGIYQLIVSAGECPSEPAQINVTVVSIPQLPSIYSDSLYCEGDTIIIYSDTITGANYSWNGPNNFSSSSNQNVILNANLNHAGNYYLSLSAGSCASDTATVFININELPASVSPFSNSPLCVGDTLIFNASNIPGYNYNWTGPDNFSSNNVSEIIFPVGIINSGNYLLTVEANGCTGIPETVNVEVNNLPVFTLGGDKTLCSGEEITLVADQQFANYIWNTGSTGMSLNVTSTGNYYLTATDVNNCRFTDSLFVNFIDCISDIPNIFTPNSDGFNDVFSINSNGMSELTCRIFNRWGELIYEFKNANDSWDGTNEQGKQCPDGVYFYTGSSIDLSQFKKPFSGFIRLVRK